MSDRLRAFSVDDEPLALRRLSRLLKESERVEVVGTSTDPEKALSSITHEPIDVVFLDIEMPGMTGLELAEKLPDQTAIIFTTAYNEYALKAFTVNSIDYLLKPIEPAQLERAISKLERLRSGRGVASEVPPTRLHAVLEELKASLGGAQYPDRIASRIGGRVHFIELERVTHFFAEDKLTYAATSEKSYVVDATISQLEQKLNPRRFLRIHRATLVNLDFVAEMHGWFGGGVQVRLKDAKGTELTVARDRVRTLKERLGV